MLAGAFRMNCKAAPGSAGKHGAGSKVPACHIPGTGTGEARPRIHPQQGQRRPRVRPVCVPTRHVPPSDDSGGFCCCCFSQVGCLPGKAKIFVPAFALRKGLGDAMRGPELGGDEGMWVREGGSPVPPFCPLALWLRSHGPSRPSVYP